MAETEIKRIIDIETSGSVRSLAELKAAVDANTKAQNALTEGTTEYDVAVQQTKKAQQDYNYALRMNAADANASAKSYNSLVATMGRLKQEWRATADEAKRAELGAQIKRINDQLKEMDASVGTFGRNVGDYAEQIKKGLRDVPSYADAIKGPLKDVSDQVGLLGSQPLFGIITLLTPVVVKLVDEIKESESAMAAVRKGMDALKPVTQFLSGIVEKVAEFLGDIIGKVTEFVANNGLFQKIINGVAGVGNAIVQFVVAPFKGVIEAIKIFKEQGVKGLGDAARAFGQEMRQGVAFKTNFEAGQVLADTIIAGAKSRTKEAAKDLAKEVAKETESALMKVQESWFTREGQDVAEWREEQKMLEEAHRDSLAMIAEDEAVIAANMKAYYDEIAEAERQMAEAEKARREAVTASASAIESILGSVAQAYNEELQAQVQAGKISEQEAKRRFAFVKAFQLSQAVINTASGVMSVFSAPDNITMTQKWLQAAAVAARGAASIASIASSNLSTGAQASQAGQVTGLMNAGASAPQVQTVVPITRVGTNAEDEERLNARLGDQRVVLVWSDVEKFGRQAEIQASETGF